MVAVAEKKVVKKSVKGTVHGIGTRKIRRVYWNDDLQVYVGWTSINNRDTKVHRVRGCRLWHIAD